MQERGRGWQVSAAVCASTDTAHTHVPSQSIAGAWHTHPESLSDPCWPHAEALLLEKAEVAPSKEDNKGPIGTSLERGF